MPPLVSADHIFFADEASRPLGRLTLAGTVKNGNGTGRKGLRVFGRYALVLVCEGQGQYHDANGIKEPVAAGSAILVFPEVPHSYGPRPARGHRRAWDEIFLCFEGPLFDLWRHEGLLDTARPVCRLPDLYSTFTSMKQLVESPRPLEWPQHFLQLQALSSILAGLSDHYPQHYRPADPPWLQKAKAALESNLEQDLGGAAVARMAGLSYESFRKQFKFATGFSPALYRTRKRLETGQLLIADSRLSQNAIAQSLGFRDSSHFSRRYRDIYGVSPRQYNELNR